MRLADLVTQIPNAMSVGRFLLGLVFPVLPRGWRLGAVAVAALSDLFDGSLGRWTHSTSKLGQLLDPIADKTFVVAVVVTLVVGGELSLLELALLCLRDLAILAICVWVAVRGPWSDFGLMRPIWSAKAATAGQFVYLVALLWRQAPVPELFWPVVVVSGIAAVRYVWLYVQSLRDRDAFLRYWAGHTPW